MRDRLFLSGVLLLMGAGWGITQPFSKIAVSGDYRHFGLIFWQLVIVALVLGLFQRMRGRPLRWDRRRLGFYILIALIGTVLPNGTSYEAARHLPSGVLSVAIATVPMFAFPIALVLGLDRFSGLRLLGLACGLAGVWLLVGPEGGLSAHGLSLWVGVALIAPLFYGVESNVVARFGTGGAGPVELLYGASIVGALIALPLAWATDSWIDPRPPWGAPDAALAAASVIHAVVYASYVWLVGRAGPVFAGQVAYLVTGFGVVWAMLLLGESYSSWFWAAFALMLAGMFLVQPRENGLLANTPYTGEDEDHAKGPGA